MRYGKGLYTGLMVAGCSAVLVLHLASAAWGQTGWRPAKATEFITSSAAGGSSDIVARLMQKIIQDGRLSAVPFVVVNKPGGNQSLGVTYLSQHAGEADYLLLATPVVLSNQIAGITPLGYTEFTPIATLLTEHTVFVVRTESPIKNMRGLTDQLKADPGAIATGAISRGGLNHLTLALAVKSAGVDPRVLKMVMFKTNSDSVTAMLGGHIQLVAASYSTVAAQFQAGRLRILAIAAPQRIGSAALANVPTLREQGIDALLSNWRGVLAPKGLSPSQVAYWEEVFAKMTATDEWKNALEARDWVGNFLRSRETASYLEAEYHAHRTVMADLGLAK